MKRCKIIAVVIFLLFLFNMPVNAENKVKSVGIYVNVPTQSQIVQFVKNNPILLETNDKVTYDVVPSIKKPYSAGKVSNKYLMEGLNAVNIVRYIAGVPSVTLDEDYCIDAQAGSVVNAANNELDHTPKKPEGMSDELFGAGYSGTSKGNLSQGRSLISQSIIWSYMEDGDPSNVEVLGHRRWVINPPMQKTGVGFAPNNFSVMYAHDNFNGYVDKKHSVTAWPAQNMPVEYFGREYPFSISLSEEFDNLDRNNIRVKMTRLSDGKIFNFNGQTSNDVNSQTYFNVDNDNYGQPHCIIWRPDVSSYKNGDVFSIEIFGVKKNGNAYPLSYNVSLFSLKNSVNTNVTNNINKNGPQISNLSLSLAKLNPQKDTVKITVHADRESSLYCKVYDKNNKVVSIAANGSKLKNSGNWYVNWKGTDANKKYLKPGKYRIDAYLSNGSGTSKVLSQYIEIISNDNPQISNLKLSSDYLNPGEDVLNIIFNADRECVVYCNVYDSKNNKKVCIANGSKIAKSGSWSLKWMGIDASGYYLQSGKYRVEVYLSNDKGTSNTLSKYVEIY